MSLLKVNEVQNYNGSSLTLTASTVSTSAQLNTGGNISVTGSINVSDDSTTRSNLGLGTMATQNANAVAITGGTINTVQPATGQSLTIKDEDGNTAITIGTDNTAASYLSLNFGSYHGDSSGSGSGTRTGNTLDDYEEGTWTCSVYGQSATATGRYVKIGALVYVEVRFLCNTNVSTTNTSSLITGLPFSASTTTRSYLHFAAQNLSAVSGNNGAPTISASVGPPYVEAIYGTIVPVSSTSSNPYYRENIFQSTSSFYMSGTYRIS